MPWVRDIAIDDKFIETERPIAEWAEPLWVFFVSDNPPFGFETL
jgi:hypothetical protein